MPARRAPEGRTKHFEGAPRPTKCVISTHSLHERPPSAYTVAAGGRKRRERGHLEKKGAGAYTRAMRRPIVIAGGVLLTALIVSGDALALAPSPRRAVRAIALPEAAVPLTLAVDRGG